MLLFLSQQLFLAPIDGGKLNLSGPKFEHLRERAREMLSAWQGLLFDCRANAAGSSSVTLPDASSLWCLFFYFLLLCRRSLCVRVCYIWKQVDWESESLIILQHKPHSLRHSPSSMPPTPLSVHAIEGNFQSESASIWVCALQEGTHKFADCYKSLLVCLLRLTI